jgi:hypothetical protein
MSEKTKLIDESNVNEKNITDDFSKMQEDLKTFDNSEAKNLTDDSAQKREEKPIIEEPLATKGKKRKNDTILSGYMLLVFCDSAFPFLISFINNMFSEKRVKAAQLRLSLEEIQELQPIADDAAKQLQVYLSPVMAFGILLSMTYATKLIDIYDTEEKKAGNLVETKSRFFGLFGKKKK